MTILFGKLFRQISGTPAEDVVFWVTTEGPVTAADIVNLNGAAAAELGVSSRLDRAAVDVGLKAGEDCGLIFGDGVGWEATPLGRAYDRWLVRS